MNQDSKKVVSVIGAVIIAVIAVYGSILPWHKSSLYIDSSRAAQSAQSLNAFTDALDPALSAASPIGQNELVRNVAGMVLSVVRNVGGNNKELTKAVVDYITSYYQPIIERGKGPSFEQDLYVLGLVNESAYVGTKDPQYLGAAKAYFEEGYRRGSHRPQFLYGLFDIYRFMGDKTNVKKITDEILTYWPGDVTIKTQADKFQQQTFTVVVSSTPGQ